MLFPPTLRTRLLPLVILLVLFAFMGGVTPDARAQVPNEIIHIDPNAPSHPFPHYWEKMFGSGRAVLSLRDSYRDDLRMLKSATDAEYIRFHAIFHDEIGLYNESGDGKPEYNFSYV